MVGGLVGVNEGTVSDSFWDLDTTQQTMSDGGTGKTTEEMKNIDTYTDIETEGLDFPWDFAGDPNDDDGIYDIWDHDRLMNEGYPFLTWIAYSVVIEPSEGRMITAGDTIRFTAAVYDRTGNVITDEAARFKWQNATEEGVFKSTVTGDHFVTATYGSRASNILTVAVEPGSAYTVEIEPAMDQNIYPGDTIDFDAVAFDGYGNIVEDEDAQFIWENTDEEGVFQETAPGVYLVRASYETITSNPVNVTVMGPIFDFSNLRTIPEEPVVGEEVELMIDVTNVGNEPGESTVEFIIDGEVVGSDTVEVGVGDTVTASVTYMIEKEGNHTLEAGGETIVFTAYEEDTLNYLLLLIPAVIIVAVLIVVILMKQDKINLKTGERRS